MQRSRLKNIINKSKVLQLSKAVGEPFDEFKKSLPMEVDNNYRLKAAWKAYGSPKNFDEAVWEGLIQPIDENNYKFPSIGYNSETDEYEYLNKGLDGESVSKDIRVWDNDVIPLVKELKLGGYIRVFDKEKDCWKYSKNKVQSLLEVNSFLKGGKSEYNKVKSDKAYYDKNSDTVYYSNDEDLIHEGFHARPDSALLEQLKPYYENLDDKKIQNLGGDLQFVKRFEGDPGHFYSPEELGAKILAAKYRTKGNNYSPEFFKYLRTNENLYGDNMRDLLHMYNDENLSKIFNLNTPLTFKQGGKSEKKKDKLSYYEFLRSLPPNLQKGNTDDGDGIEKDDGYRMELLFQNAPDVWTFEDGVKNGYFSLNEEDGLYHSGSVIEMPDGHYEFLKSSTHPTVKYETDWYKYHPTAKEFREKYELVTTDENGNPLKYYKYIKRNPKAFKSGGLMNVIPEGALHAHKNHMELAKDGMVTSKGIPVVTDEKDIQQTAEIERDEIIFNKEVTQKLENYYKKFYSDDLSKSEKDEIAIKAGKLLADLIINNTEDNTGLIEKVLNKM